ncbi:protease modulator HflC [Halobacillus rhizosphaerae]|uniref:protease modulator HflC n=1 Tax=Halobacillus rhizosphaerae TaxID=3064889 RepID=UPI00398BB95F
MSEKHEYAAEGKQKDYRKYIKAGITILIFAAVIFLALSSVIIVKEGQYKVVRQFGEVVKIHDTPGLKFKVPLLQDVSTLSKRKMVYDVAEKEITTLDKKRIIIDNYAIWSITDPEKMISNARLMTNAEARMGEFIFSTVRTELGKMDKSEVINEKETSRGALNKNITNKVNELLARDNYGIKVDDVRIKRIDLPQDNEATIFRRMVTDREEKAQEYLSQGEADKNRIMAQTDRKVKEMLATARAKAEQIHAEGDQQAAKIYNQAFKKDPEFYKLYRTLQSYRKTVNGDTTIVLPEDSPYTELLQGHN